MKNFILNLPAYILILFCTLQLCNVFFQVSKALKPISYYMETEEKIFFNDIFNHDAIDAIFSIFYTGFMVYCLIFFANFMVWVS